VRVLDAPDVINALSIPGGHILFRQDCSLSSRARQS
jgi:hypothetical protein